MRIAPTVGPAWAYCSHCPAGNSLAAVRCYLERDRSARNLVDLPTGR
jgi:hypothetical protein